MPRLCANVPPVCDLPAWCWQTPRARPATRRGCNNVASGKTVLLLGATGTIGRATAAALLQAGHHLSCLLRPGATVPDGLSGAEVRFGDVTSPQSLTEVFGWQPFDVVISCLASRSGAPDDAWAIDHRANVNAINAAQAAGAGQFILLSAICVQKPRLTFQHAKLAAEEVLTASGLPYSIVRPTAFFKSLSGQIARVQAGKPFLVFGDGTLTACKPMSDRDLGQYLAECIGDPDRMNQILPIGGPGPAITPRDQADYLFKAMNRMPKIKQVPLAMMKTIAGTLGAVSRIVPPLRDKAEFARIGLYYASESMLVWDGTRYDADATPSFGADTLFGYYDRVLAGQATVERGDHSVF